LESLRVLHCLTGKTTNLSSKVTCAFPDFNYIVADGPFEFRIEESAQEEKSKALVSVWQYLVQNAQQSTKANTGITPEKKDSKPKKDCTLM
jgi:hypothetical protein